VKKTRQNKKIERGRDSIQSERALEFRSFLRHGGEEGVKPTTECLVEGAYAARFEAGNVFYSQQRPNMAAGLPRGGGVFC
jgi:hypothetical protein